jgi:hypothetical protein
MRIARWDFRGLLKRGIRHGVGVSACVVGAIARQMSPGGVPDPVGVPRPVLG